MLSHLTIPTFCSTVADLSLHQVRFSVLIGVTIFVCISAVALTLSAIHRLRIQSARADKLAGNLEQVREEARRRLLFLNTISHDLRTPLNGITLQTHVIEQALAVSDQKALAAAVADIRASSALAAEILAALLQFAHTDIDQTVVAPVNLKDLIHQTADPFRAAAEEKSLAFNCAVPPALTMQTDPAKLQRILANLLANAVKFTSTGSITVKADAGGTLPPPTDPRKAVLAPAGPGVTPDHQAITITVHDTGCGIPPEMQSRLFKEFFQANNPSRDARLGLGLGLVIAQRLAHQLAGNLTCTSTPNQGTTFQLILPQSLGEPVH